VTALAVNRDSRRAPRRQVDRAALRGVFPYYGASGVIDFIDDYIFDGEFVLIGEDGENLRSRQLPLALIATGRFWVNNHAHIFEPLKNTDIGFLAIILEAQDDSPWLSGSAQPKLTCRIADALCAFDARLVAERSAIDKYAKLKFGLMSGLLTGRVRVLADFELS
jgi:type I restriction enzyme, S subunit